MKRYLLLLCSAILVLCGSIDFAVAADQSTTTSIVVKLVAGLTVEEQAAVIARNGGVETATVKVLRLHTVSVPNELLQQAMANYQADPQVERVELNKLRRAEAIPVDPSYSLQWALSKIGWEDAYGTVAPTGTATVALLDSGVDATHTDLAGKILPGTSILDGSNGLTDQAGHGTWLAGIIAAVTGNGVGVAGVAYDGVSIVPVTVLNANGEGKDSDIIQGIIWAADNGANVILMAFSNADFSQNLQDAIDYAWEKGAVLVAATGNGGVSTPTFPAGDRGVIGVSATDQSDALTLGSNYGQDVFLAAPGSDIYTTSLGSTYATITGTSASSAIVAGVAGFMRAVEPTLANGVIVGRLARSADAIGTAGDPNNQVMFGNGRINMAKALADTGIDSVQPAGTPGGGGPYVGPYVAAALGITSVSPNSGSTLGGTSVTITGTSYTPGQAPFTVTFGGIAATNVTRVDNTRLTATTPAHVAGAVNVNVQDKGGTPGVTLTNGFTYVKAAATVTLSNLTQTYTGSPLYPTATTSPVSGLTIDWTNAPQTNAGSYSSVTATVNDPNYQGSASGTFKIEQATQAISITTEPPASAVYGTNFTVAASGGGSGNAVVITTSGGCTNVGGTVTMTSGTTACAIQFNQAGNSNYKAAPEVTRSVTVQKAAATVTLSNLTQTYTGSPLTPSATTSPVSGLTIDWTNAPQTNAGSYSSVTATVNDPNYQGSASGTFIINRANQTITFAALSDKTAGSSAFGVSASASSALTVNFSSQTTKVCTVTGTTVTLTNLAGTCTIRASQGGDANYNLAADVDQSFNVTPGSAVAFTVSAPSSSMAGSFFDISVTAKDTYNNVATGYAGIVHFTTTDGHAGVALPADFTFAAADNGTHTFGSGAALLTAGNQTVTATDIVTASITGTSGSINITPAAATIFSITAPPTAMAGIPLTVAVTAQDAYGNTDTNYIGTAHFTSTDTRAEVALPGDYLFVAGDNGSHAFTSVTLVTAGSQTVTAVDTAKSTINGTSGSIAVGPAAPSKLTFIAQPTNTTALQKIAPAVAVAVQDQYGNVVTSNADTVALAIGSNPAAGTLSGTASRAAVSGVATFDDLSIDYAGTGYTLAATSGSLAGAMSNSFDIAKANQAITVTGHAPASATYGTSFTLDASASSGLSLTYSSAGGCTNIGAIFTMTSGTTDCTVMYDQPGNASYNPALQIKETVSAQKANANITVTLYDVTYDGNAHTATGTAKGVEAIPADLSSLLTLSGTTHTDAGDYTADAWIFAGNGNYNTANGTVHDKIAKANAAINVTAYDVTYDGNAHTATGTAKGVKNEDLSGLNLSGTTHTNAGTYTDSWTFTDVTGNYNNVTATTVTDKIAKANAAINVTAYDVTYDGNTHTAAGTAKGVKNEDLSGLNLSGTTHTNAGTYTDSWTFTDVTGNYNNVIATMVTDKIDKANATINVVGMTVTYDGNAHGASGAATGVKNEDLSASLNLGGTYTNVPGGSAHWTFTGGTNYNDVSGDVAIVINKADPAIVVTPYSVTYDGNDHTATGTAKGVKNEVVTGLDLGGTRHTAAGTYATDPWTFTDSTGNYNNKSGMVSDNIAKADPVVTATGNTCTYNGSPCAGSGTVTGVKGETLTPVNIAYKDALGNLLTSAPVNAGAYSVAARYAGDTNYNQKQSAAATVTINKAPSTTAVTVAGGTTFTYDGNDHSATVSVTGAGSLSLTPAPVYNCGHAPKDVSDSGCTASFNFAGDTNHDGSSDSKTYTISKADATVSVSGWTGTYNATAHGATGTATGVGGANLNASLNLGTPFTDVPGSTAHWTFTGGINYNDQSGDVAITINPADAVCSVSGYTGNYDVTAHGATGTCTGVGSVILAGLDLGAKYTDYPGGSAHWTFNNSPNYKSQNGDVAIVVNKTDATINVIGWTGSYDGSAHGASGTAKGVGGVDLSASLNLGTTFSDVPGGTTHWTFTGGTNYNDTNGDVAITINSAPTSISISTATLTNNPNPTAAVSVTSGAGIPDGPISLKVNSASLQTATLINGTATFTMALPADGIYDIQADYDAHGNYSASSKLIQLTLDTVSPNTVIDSGPVGMTLDTNPTFSFHGSDASGDTYECTLDGVVALCTSPSVNYTGLQSGPHTFQVRARDAAGNVDATPASRTWIIGSMLNNLVTMDENFKKTDGFEVLFGKGTGTSLKITNTTPKVFHFQLLYTNNTGMEINTAGGGTTTAVVEVPGMPSMCGPGLSCSSSLGSLADPAFTIKNSRAIHIRPDGDDDGDGDDLPINVQYMTLAGYEANGNSCAATPNAAYSSTMPADGAAKCIKISGFSIPKKHKARIRINFEFRPKGTDGWNPNAKRYFMAGFPFKSATTVTYGTASQTSIDATGLVGAGTRMTAIGGFVFNTMGIPQSGSKVRIFKSMAQAQAASCSSDADLVAQDVVDTTGFYYIWRAGGSTNQDQVGNGLLPFGVQYAVQVCNGATQLGLKPLENRLSEKEFEQVDFEL